jgi:glucose/arabinose dehydrogenase
MRIIVLGLLFAIGPLAEASPCDPDNGGITLSPGFCATVFADNVGHARHLDVAPNGVVYVNTWSGVYYGNDTPPSGGFLVALQDTNADGRADLIKRFGDGVPEGSVGGTGIRVYNGFLYAEQNDRIIRYALPAGSAVPTSKPETIVSGLPITLDHPMHPFIIDANGNLFVSMGSVSNTCELKNRMPGSKGHEPCTELETRAGIWRYDANKTGQKFSPAERYATGIRNVGGLSFDSAGRLYTTQHGRDQLSESWPALYKPEQGRELPAEEIMLIEKDADYGWPYCYFDGVKKKLVLAPEYGGDGKTVGVCAKKRAPVAFFPAHWAPNGLAIYTGTQFPKPYQGGAFVAFHGSWNRAPGPQGGYNVVYQPMADGKASGNYVVFADGFAGDEKAPGRAKHRPSGLAVGPDGALFISEDVKGRIWRVTYDGATSVTKIAAAPAPKSAGAAAKAAHSLKAPPGATADDVALGARIFRGDAAGGNCTGCHGSDGKGSSVGPDLTSATWLWSDGSLKGLTQTITNGVPVPKKSLGAMPPKGGAPLSTADVHAVAAYVWAISHTK